ncbi:PREDICTED: purple acid phosphatase 17-like [Lupinus angustifolius]|uniref:purple acid phosphatase 17-like n=1 Tax=Lupinus angustifolius TaxID=3871 RepID=UPI00092E494A|nr:PREDICTED: purple acid phosphatase 17-like [Lupinus angustifolius]
MALSTPTFILQAILCIYFVLLPSFAKLQRFQHQPKHDGSLSFLVIGDWGRQGLYNQSLVATQMGIMGEKLNIDFVISTGDNFYDEGIKGVNDPLFKQSFSNIYTAKSLQKQWYSVLGNHDYRGDTIAQLNPLLRKIDRRWFCMRSFTLNTGIAEFFFIDTTPFISDYFNEFEHTYDWRDVSPRKNYLNNILKDFEEALSKSTATWKIVVGHHAIRSISHHGDSPELLESLAPMLKANGVDMYLNGHDHCLQHISSKDSPLVYITSGAGSKAWRGDIKENNVDEVRFFYDGQGFMSVQMTETEIEFSFLDVFGEIIHNWRIQKSLHSSA